MKKLYDEARKIIIKIGSSTLTSENGEIDYEFLQNLADQVYEIINDKKQVVIVSSGARIAGISSTGKWSRKEDINYKQALCAIGQVELMNAYKKTFIEKGFHIGQLLLTRGDFETPKRNLNIRNTLFTLIDENVIPVVNENDTVSVEEIRIGDNDMLAARTAVLWGADITILLSDIDGIYDKNPKEYKDAKLIEQIENIFEYEKNIDTSGKSSFGTGGMATKIEAAKLINTYGSTLIITKGKQKDAILKTLRGEIKSTIITSPTK